MSVKMRSVIVVPARMESSRFYAKLIQNLGGITVIERVLTQCLKTTRATEVYLATNSTSIIQKIEHLPVHVLYKNKEYANGTERIADSISHLNDINIVLNVQGDEPFVEPQLLDQMISCLSSEPEISICTARSLEQFNSVLPEDVKVLEDENSFAIKFQREPISSLNKSYKHIGIYGFKYDVLQKLVKLPQTENETLNKLEQLRWMDHNYRIKMIISQYKSISIDTPEDLNLARLLLSKMSDK